MDSIVPMDDQKRNAILAQVSEICGNDKALEEKSVQLATEISKAIAAHGEPVLSAVIGALDYCLEDALRQFARRVVELPPDDNGPVN
jgi:hypothetical protein